MTTLLLAFTFSTLILQISAAKPRQIEKVDGRSTRGEFIDTNPKTSERLYLRYPVHYDGGADLELTGKDSLLWRVFIQPLGIQHSAYRQDVTMLVDEGKIIVTIKGAKIIEEIRELRTGNLISRKIYEHAAK
jgi:hypothetical protein